MKPAYRGIAVGLLQCLIVLSAFGKYELDRERLPRVWVQTAPFDPNLPIRGRYLSLRLEVEYTPSGDQTFATGHLAIREGRLFLDPGGDVRAMRVNRDRWNLMEPIAFFLPEHAADPSQVPAGKELWVEVSVPRKGPPRPIRLEVR